MFSKVIALTTLFGIAMASLPVAHEPVHHHAPQPYKFGYDIKDKHGEKFRQETGDGHSGVKGSYGFTDARGVKRQVDYVADKAGFRAQVKTNEPGTANQNPAAVLMVSNAPYAGGYGAPGAVGYGGAGALGYGGAGALGYGGAGALGYGGAGALGYGGSGAVGYGGVEAVAYGGAGAVAYGGAGARGYGGPVGGSVGGVANGGLSNLAYDVLGGYGGGPINA